MVAPSATQHLSITQPRRPDPPAPRLFNVNVADIPSGTLGILATIVSDDMDRLAKRIRRDGHTDAVRTARAVLEQLRSDLDHEAAGRDRARWLEARR